MEQVLETIVAKSRKELAESRKRIPASLLESRIPELPPVRDFAAALRRPGRRIIAELKAASPSKGAIRPELDREVERLAAGLEAAGAAALSVLTERNFFLGSGMNLRRARGSVDIPLLRKDFIYDEYQILEARVWGADAILLIAAMLTPEEFRKLRAFAASLGSHSGWRYTALPKPMSSSAYFTGMGFTSQNSESTSSIPASWVFNAAA